MSTAVKSDPSKWKRIVASVKASGKGGAPGQWSARKAQLATQRYKSSGGGYKGQNGPIIAFPSGASRSGPPSLENPPRRALRLLGSGICPKRPSKGFPRPNMPPPLGQSGKGRLPANSLSPSPRGSLRRLKNTGAGDDGCRGNDL